MPTVECEPTVECVTDSDHIVDCGPGCCTPQDPPDIAD